MEQKLYDIMDWAGIEELTYSESADPHRMLGPHATEEGLLIQAFIPTATAITVKLTGNGKKYPMELADEAGFYAVLIPRKTVTDYTLLVTYDNGTEEEIHDPYSFGPQFTEDELKKFGAGIYYDIYEKMGAHPMTIDGVEGVYFAVWAPCAMRVSVVGDFNLWDGRRHQMRKVGEGDASVFELFIPGLKAGCLYKYEIKTRAGLPMMKADPYGNYAELRPNNASIVWDINNYQWKDKKWMDKRAASDTKDKPFNIYEVHLGSWMRKEIAKDENGEDIIGSEFYNYRELAVKLAEYVKDMGYTHVELLPIMEHPLDASWGYQVTGYYAPTSRYGTPDDFMYFMDYMHEQGIGVILDWVPAHFPKDAHGLADFDGTATYEYADPRLGEHPDWGTKVFDFGKNEVRNFLISNALFWIEKFHIDGLRVDAVASMLYLDYGRKDGEWVANKYGENKNLEVIDFFKHLNSVVLGRNPGALMIAEESTAWPKVTGDVEEGGLGFSLKWNMGWMHDFTEYMKLDPYFRKDNHHLMTFAMSYAYSENYILVLSHDEVVHLKCSMLNKMPGLGFDKYANLKAGYAFMMGHAGKKLLFMGQEFAQLREWSEERELDWFLLAEPEHQQMKEWVKALLHLYKSHKAMYEMDQSWEGFEWINADDGYRSIYSFMRHSKGAKKNLLFVCNFTPMARDDYRVGVPRKKQYKLILNSDEEKYGGTGEVRKKIYKAEAKECDGRPYSFAYKLPPYGVAVFEF
jgi:1,4-alpha-glucan branching enzyme